jgi:uncharacterized protein (TIGR00369 family)
MEIREPLALQIGLKITEIRQDGLTTSADVRPEVINPYGMAHGGYLHALGQLSAVLSAQQRYGGAWEVSDASCQYLRALRKFPARTVTKQVNHSGDTPVYRAEVMDAAGAVCITQIIGLKREQEYPDERLRHTPTITAANPMPKDLDAEPPFPCLSTSFSRHLNCYSVRKLETGLVYALDLNENNTDAHGFAHSAAMFTVADSAACGSLMRIERKSPITVSASIRYLAKAEASLVEARPRLTRSGRVLYYYDVDLVDGNGTLAAVAQFVIQSLDK